MVSDTENFISIAILSSLHFGIGDIEYCIQAIGEVTAGKPSLLLFIRKSAENQN